MPGRSYSSGSYRYGFNGQEKSDEIKGSGNSYTAMFWEYDPRIGRRWNIDPVRLSDESGYSAFSNNPILYVDRLGDFRTKAGALVHKFLNGGGGEIRRTRNGDYGYNKSTGSNMDNTETSFITNWQKVNGKAFESVSFLPHNYVYTDDFYKQRKRSNDNYKKEKADSELKPLLTGTAALTAGYFGVSAGAFGNRWGGGTGATVDLLAWRDYEKIVKGYNTTTKQYQDPTIIAELYFSQYGISHSINDNTKNQTTSILVNGIEFSGQTAGAGSVKYNLAGIKVGMGIGIEASVDVNLSFTGAGAIVLPISKGYASSESTRLPKINILIPTK